MYAASGTLDDASACLPWAIPQIVCSELGSLFERVHECCGCRRVSLRCPVVEAVCLGLLGSWQTGRLFILFLWDSTVFFSLRKLGHHRTLSKFIFS